MIVAPTKHRILIVDDDDGVRHSLARIIRAKGHEVQTARNGHEAIGYAEKLKPDLVILDIRMPGIDGIETLHQIRQLIPSVAAIFMTAYVVSSQADAARHCSGVSIVPKPLDLDSLSDLVSHCVGGGE